MNVPLVRAFALDDLVHRRPVAALGGERRCDPEPFTHGPADWSVIECQCQLVGNWVFGFGSVTV